MIIINVKEAGSFDKAMKKLKKKFKDTRVAKELFERKEYKKPSVKKRETKKNAQRKNKYNLNKF
jgi:small subunit ribosomal protein S21